MVSTVRTSAIGVTSETLWNFSLTNFSPRKCFQYPTNNGHTTWQLLSASSKEWWNVKDTLKTLPGDATNPAAFKVGTRSPLRDLPTGDSTKYIRIDPAHTFAIDGVGKDFLASCIIMMIRAEHFGNGNVPHSFQNAYASFLAYCNAYKKNTSITEFGYNTFKLPQNSCLVSSYNVFWISTLTKKYGLRGTSSTAQGGGGSFRIGNL